MQASSTDVLRFANHGTIPSSCFDNVADVQCDAPTQKDQQVITFRNGISAHRIHAPSKLPVFLDVHSR